MRHEWAVAAVAALCLLSGCQTLPAPGPDHDAGATPTVDETVELDVETPATTEATPAGAGDAPPDPATDRLGWEAGYWHNETLSVTTEDGLNESERRAVVSRAMARVEVVRRLEFAERVPVETVSRERFRENRGGTVSAATRRFDDAKFEALFLIGEDRDAVAVQESTLGESVLGYYSPRRDAIVLVTDTETPSVDESTLAHELVHALQDQRFGLRSDARTRDAVQGRNGLVEGDAVATTADYTERCGASWSCLSGGAGASAGGGDRHFGLSFLLYFPYSDGAGLVADLRDRGGWAAVNDAYGEVPDGAREVTNPGDYPEWEPREVELSDRSSDEWERVRPPGRPDYGVVGPSAIAATMAYTIADDYNGSAVVQRRAVFDYAAGGGLAETDPYDYTLPGTAGWDGGRLHVYTNGTATASVWRTGWDSPAAAAAFAAAWGDVLGHWGGRRVGEHTWTLAGDSPYAGAVAVRVEGDTVTVVNAPSQGGLSEIHNA
ncbi:Hvo_1808 family surface protein [Haloarcula litorea]|uniref:Hvo_1808 family surface protein n=1 Tax=Haloarcula litorea TaxID=3032579 RepID=UPI0023E89E91|nr:Hvo_1808 family surface protein [Halomicroarcula sp. GDY20]